jgi:hypothetical protein
MADALLRGSETTLCAEAELPIKQVCRCRLTSRDHHQN